MQTLIWIPVLHTVRWAQPYGSKSEYTPSVVPKYKHSSPLSGLDLSVTHL
jgi:hypothetical protein